MCDLRKRAGLPEMDPNAIPSSYVLNIQKCTDTRTKKLNELLQSFDAVLTSNPKNQPDAKNKSNQDDLPTRSLGSMSNSGKGS